VCASADSSQPTQSGARLTAQAQQNRQTDAVATMADEKPKVRSGVLFTVCEPNSCAILFANKTGEKDARGIHSSKRLRNYKRKLTAQTGANANSVPR